MRILVTGASGFVGRWLVPELASAGHSVIETGPAGQRVDVTNPDAVRDLVQRTRPDGVVHLAAVSYGPDARDDPAAAMRVNVGGTSNLLTALCTLPSPPAVLVAGSSEVYGTPDPADLPMTEATPLRAIAPYGVSKLEQERSALDIAARHGLRLAVTRAFNHTGPGQRPVFVMPALVDRMLAFRAGSTPDVVVGNLDVRRDFSDVRDVVQAYRLVLESLADPAAPQEAVVYNVCSGRAVSIREIVGWIGDAVGVAPALRVDPALRRSAEAPEIRGDATKLRSATGWSPIVPLEQTILDIVEARAGDHR